MTHLINKDALVAEIESLDALYHTSKGLSGDLFIQGLFCFIDTTEVKEVDSLTPEEIKKICTIYDNLNQERNRGAVLYNSDETFFNHVLMEYKSIAKTT